MMYIVVTAFGKALKNKKEIKAHYVADKDFIIMSVVHGPGRHINRLDVERLGNIKLEVRYGKHGEKVTIIP